MTCWKTLVVNQSISHCVLKTSWMIWMKYTCHFNLMCTSQCVFIIKDAIDLNNNNTIQTFNKKDDQSFDLWERFAIATSTTFNLAHSPSHHPPTHHLIASNFNFHQQNMLCYKEMNWKHWTYMNLSLNSWWWWMWLKKVINY
jgi:hypothetical protein